MALTAALRASSPPVRARDRAAWPSLVETGLAVVAIVAIAPGFEALESGRFARHDRFAAPAVHLSALPAPVLPELCKRHGMAAERVVRERLCGTPDIAAPVVPPAGIPVLLADTRRRIDDAFQTAVQRASQAQSNAEASDRPDDAQIRNFAARYTLAASPEGVAPQTLTCAYLQMADAMRHGAPRNPRGDATALANAVLLLGAATDGHAATASVARTARLPDSTQAVRDGCASRALSEALAAAATTMADARSAVLENDKRAAMRELRASAGWQWAAWMLAGLFLVKLARTGIARSTGIAIALAVWAAAAWAGRVPWPLGGERTLQLGRVDVSWDAMPATFVLVLIATAAAMFAIAPFTPRRTVVGQTLSSRAGYAGFVAATGLGWMLLLDLSLNGPPANRYLALYHHGHLWLAMLVLTVVAFLRPALGSSVAWLLSMLDDVGERARRLLGPALTPVMLALLIVVLAGGAGVMLSGVRQLTSELGRLWVIVGVAWFFYLRAAAAGDALARRGALLPSLARYTWPLAFIALVLVAFMLVTRDMGPLLIAAYSAGAFLAASMAMWWHLRTQAIRAPATFAAVAFSAWIVAITIALFQFGSIDAVTADRLENLAAPLASANDQLALVTWFREATPANGFGIGRVPWCGFAGTTACAGVPAQIQSDYTFTALVGTFGEAAAWAFTLACALWLHRLIRYHGRVTRGEPRFVQREGRVVADSQAFLSWMSVTWVVLTLCQLAVTVAGNLSVLPLTGVTFPFVSFGMTSLVVNGAMLALCISIDVPEREDA